MKIEEYWEKYISQDLVEIYPATKEFFAEKIPKKAFDEYDLEEVVLETNGALRHNKQFEKSVEFIKIIRNKQPKIYKTLYYYLTAPLIDYYCYHGRGDEIDEPLKDFIANPVKGIDDVLISFEKLVYYQYIKQAGYLAQKTYKKIDNSYDLMPGSGIDLAYIRLFIEFEKELKNFDEHLDLNRNRVVKSCEKYGLTPDQKVLDCFYAVFSNKKITPALIKELCGNKVDLILILFESFFMQFLRKKSISPVTGGYIFSKCLKHWKSREVENEANIEEIFQLSKNSYDEFLNENESTFFINLSYKSAAYIWILQLIYNFLYEEEYISEEFYKKCTGIILQLKADFIVDNINMLWQYSFVHCWNINVNDQFLAEKELFDKTYTYNFKPNEMKNLVGIEGFKQLYDRMGITDFIIKKQKSKNSSKNNIFSNFVNAEKTEETEAHIINKPYIAEKKIGRNDPCPCGSGKKYKKCCGK